MTTPRARAERASTPFAIVLLGLALAALAPDAAHAQITDTVVVHGAKTIVQLDASDAIAGKDFTYTELSATALLTCKQTAAGVYCVDGQAVVRWNALNSKGAPQPPQELQCNALPGAGTRATCTGMTVDAAGALWIAVRAGNSHSVYKAVKTATCATATINGYCARLLYSGRPPLVDLDVVDAGTPSFPQAGTIGLEERKSAVFFPDAVGGTVKPLASGKEWNLAGGEQLLALTLQVTGDTSYLLAATTNGRVMRRKVGDTLAAVEIYNVPAGRPAGAATCTSGEQNYELRVSATSGLVYLTDRNYCEVLAIDPAKGVDAAGRWTSVRRLSTKAAAGVAPATLASPADVWPTGVSISTGTTFDISAGCGPNADRTQACPVLPSSEAGKPRLSLIDVVLAKTSTAAGVTVFELKNIPDCRYADRFSGELATERQALCAAVKGQATPDTTPAAGARLNVTPLLPAELTAAVAKSGVFPGGKLPDLWVPKYLRGQAGRGYLFDAIFVLPQKGIRYDGAFRVRFDVPRLLGISEDLRRCEPWEGATLQQWDVTASISDLYPTTASGESVAALTNVNCYNPTEGIGSRFSLLPYDLEMTPDTYGPTFSTATNAYTGPTKMVEGDDAIFAKLIVTLYDDLKTVLDSYACTQKDGPDGGPNVGTGAPLSDCGALRSTWQNGKQKLDKCIAAAYQPKSSAGAENCQAFVSQLTNFRAALPAATPDNDYANRVGELKGRADVILYNVDKRLLPSIALRTNGFCREIEAPNYTSACPKPW